ncbi:hypothetical protein R4Z09_11650 [Niallia oryzisoli]|uniref:Uncharacterized protein n=1 Tax=Niallia oryzisoli TaxID=1737571 RepID=A0ABZ2CKN3_9BACI
MKITSGAIDQLEHFSQFKTVEDFQRHVKKILVDYNNVFINGDQMALQMLALFSHEIPGVSNPSIASVVKASNEYVCLKPISRSTFKRMIQKAKAFGLLTVFETEKENGYQLSNLYIFNK